MNVNELLEKQKALDLEIASNSNALKKEIIDFILKEVVEDFTEASINDIPNPKEYDEIEILFYGANSEQYYDDSEYHERDSLLEVYDGYDVLDQETYQSISEYLESFKPDHFRTIFGCGCLRFEYRSDMQAFIEKGVDYLE